ncbi:MAG: hypothetical protein KAT65_27390 [Methanophagales archaeon]|nr:hypothetical protein [Methanophagales archaeon]
MVDSAREKRIVDITYLERINADDSYWCPESPIYLLPATEEIIILEDLLLVEAMDCAKKIISFKTGEEDEKYQFIYKQWGEIAELSEEELVKRIKNDLKESYTIEAIRDAFNSFFLKIYEEYPVSKRDYLSQIARKLANLFLGPIPYYFEGNNPEYLSFNAAFINISDFMIKNIEGEEPPILFNDRSIYKYVEKVINLDEADIRKQAGIMYKQIFNQELAVGSLKEIKANALVDSLNINDIIEGKITMDNSTLKALEKVFSYTGKVGVDDNIGWDRVVETLGLENIKPVSLIGKKTKEIIKTEKQWKELVNLYPYLETVNYKETAKNEYLENYGYGLWRKILFDKHKKELSIDEVIKDSDYIENKIKEYKEKSVKSKNLIKSYKKDVWDAKELKEYKEKIAEDGIKKDIDSLTTFIARIDQEIKRVKNERRKEIEKLEKTILIRKKDREQRIEEVKASKGKEIEELKKEKVSYEKQIELKETIEIDLLIDDETSKYKREILEKEALIDVERKRLERYNSIVDGLEWKPKREGSSLMTGAITPVIGYLLGLSWEWAVLIGIAAIISMNLFTEKRTGHRKKGVFIEPELVGKMPLQCGNIQVNGELNPADDFKAKVKDKEKIYEIGSSQAIVVSLDRDESIVMPGVYDCTGIAIKGKKEGKIITVAAHIRPGYVENALPSIFNEIQKLGLSDIKLAVTGMDEDIKAVNKVFPGSYYERMLVKEREIET